MALKFTTKQLNMLLEIVRKAQGQIDIANHRAIVKQLMEETLLREEIGRKSQAALRGK